MAAPLPTDSVDALLARLPRLAEIAPGCPFAAQLDAGRPLSDPQRVAFERLPVGNFRFNAMSATNRALRTARRARAAASRSATSRLTQEIRYLAEAVHDAQAWTKRAMEKEAV